MAQRLEDAGICSLVQVRKHKRALKLQNNCSDCPGIIIIILLMIMVERIQQKLTQEIPENQATYKKRRGTRDMLVSLQVISEKILSIGQKEYIVFIDYSKAFDSVSHSKLFNILLKIGFPRHIVALIKSLYDEQVGIIKWDGKIPQSSLFSRECDKGVSFPHTSTFTQSTS